MMLRELDHALPIHPVLKNLLDTDGKAAQHRPAAGQNQIEFRAENSGVWRYGGWQPGWGRLRQGEGRRRLLSILGPEFSSPNYSTNYSRIRLLALFSWHVMEEYPRVIVSNFLQQVSIHTTSFRIMSLAHNGQWVIVNSTIASASYRRKTALV